MLKDDTAANWYVPNPNAMFHCVVKLVQLDQYQTSTDQHSEGEFTLDFSVRSKLVVFLWKQEAGVVGYLSAM